MHNLHNAVWVRNGFSGVVSCEVSSDGSFSTAIDVTAAYPRILFIIHGVTAGTTSDSVMHWKATKNVTTSDAASAADSDYTDITDATHGVITVATSDTTMGPYLLDVDAFKAVGSTGGSIRLQLYTSDATTMTARVVALGYGGEVSRQDSDVVVSV